jgi:hypothetical protein
MIYSVWIQPYIYPSQLHVPYKPSNSESHTLPLTLVCIAMATSLVISFCVIISLFGCVSAQQQRAFFVFGDSLVDSGNNDFLATTARADNYPYGIDYPPSHRATGRFSNGYNIPDLISMIEFITIHIIFKINMFRFSYTYIFRMTTLSHATYNTRQPIIFVSNFCMHCSMSHVCVRLN